jgi:hypothetical protein
MIWTALKRQKVSITKESWPSQICGYSNADFQGTKGQLWRLLIHFFEFCREIYGLISNQIKVS